MVTLPITCYCVDDPSAAEGDLTSGLPVSILIHSCPEYGHASAFVIGTLIRPLCFVLIQMDRWVEEADLSTLTGHVYLHTK
jgi:hypothetical protein